jgi:hypothetical protein
MEDEKADEKKVTKTRNKRTNNTGICRKQRIIQS